MKTSVALLLSGLAAQQVTATWNRHAGRFNTPQYNNNECTDKQKEGYNWQDIPQGEFSGYEDFNFKGGWTCAESFGKRDSLTKRTFNSKCIKNKVSRQAPAAFDCNTKPEGFSVKEIQVSVEYDTDIEFHYKMPDNSLCKQIAPCKKEGTIVENTQCGGAREVEIYLGNNNQGDREDCEIGFHHIDFDCNPAYTPSTPPQTSPSAPETSSVPPPPAETSSVAPPPGSETSAPPPVETPSAPTETPSAPIEIPTSVPFYLNSTIVIVGPSSSVAAPATSIPAVETSTSAFEGPGYETSTAVPEVPGSSSSAASPAESTSLAPPTESSSSAVPEAPSSPPSNTQVPGESSSIVPPSLPTTSAPATPENPGYTPPECLPKCMNTWLEIQSECKDNTDSECYCKNPDFTKSVIECVAAWSTDSETQQALQYLLGICASHVPENPGLITDCPTYIPLNPTAPAATPTPSSVAPPAGSPPAGSSSVDSPPASSAPAGSPPCSSCAPPEGSAPVITDSPPAITQPSIPVTTITYETTVTLTESQGTTTSTTVSTISTYITVPQVVFETSSPTLPPAPGVSPSEAPVLLVPGTPPSVPAQTTLPPYPYPTNGVVPTTLGTGFLPPGNATASLPPQFTGAASSVGVTFSAGFFGAVLAILAL